MKELKPITLKEIDDLIDWDGKWNRKVTRWIKAILKNRKTRGKMEEKIKEIEEEWDYPNADKLDWNKAKDTVDYLLSYIKKLKEAIQQEVEGDCDCSRCERLRKLIEEGKS